MKETLSIVKIGGNVIEDVNGLSDLLQSFSQIKGAKILVHGGGKKSYGNGEQIGC